MDYIYCPYTCTLLFWCNIVCLQYYSIDSNKSLHIRYSSCTHIRSKLPFLLPNVVPVPGKNLNPGRWRENAYGSCQDDVWWTRWSQYWQSSVVRTTPVKRIVKQSDVSNGRSLGSSLSKVLSNLLSSQSSLVQSNQSLKKLEEVWS